MATKRTHESFPQIFAKMALLAGIDNFDYEAADKELRPIGKNEMFIVRFEMWQMIIEWNSDNEIVELHFALRR